MSEITHSAAENHQELETLLDGILADLTSLKNVVDPIKTLVNDIRAKLLGDYVDGATGLAIGSDKPKVAHGAFDYHINGQEYHVDADATGTALSGDTVPDAKAGAWALEINAAGTISIVPAAANGTGYASAVLALAGIPAQSADKARLGTVTVVNSGATFIPGTTNLDAATVTDTYADATPLLTQIGDAVSASVGTLQTTT